MIAQIKLVTTEYDGGRKVDQVRIWVAGIPFHCDLSEYTERMAHRIAKEAGIEVIDHRDETMSKSRP